MSIRPAVQETVAVPKRSCVVVPKPSPERIGVAAETCREPASERGDVAGDHNVELPRRAPEQQVPCRSPISSTSGLS